MKSIKFLAKLIADGRITIPKEVREYLNAENGDFLQFEASKISGEDET